jgi:hypothetical protein
VRKVRTSSTRTPSTNNISSNKTNKNTTQSFASILNFFFSSTGKSSKSGSYLNSYLDPEKAYYPREDKTRISLPPAAEWKPLQRTKSSKERTPIDLDNAPLVLPPQAHVEAAVAQNSPKTAFNAETPSKPRESRARDSRVRSSSPHLPYRKPLPLLPPFSSWLAPQSSDETSSSSRTPPMRNLTSSSTKPTQSSKFQMLKDRQNQDTWTNNTSQEAIKATKVKLLPQSPHIVVEPSKTVRRNQIAGLRREQHERRRMRMMLRDASHREGLPLGIFGIGGTPASSQRDDSSSVLSGS